MINKEKPAKRHMRSLQQADEVMTLKQVADYLKVSQITVHRLAHSGSIPGVKIGRQWRFSRHRIELILRRRGPMNGRES